MIGAKLRAVEVAEDRQLFKDAMTEIGLQSARSQRRARPRARPGTFSTRSGFPRSSARVLPWADRAAGSLSTPRSTRKSSPADWTFSPVHEVLVEQSLLGWKEFELEVMRDLADNVVIICSIENFDPMGVHTGDSITVAPGADSDRQGVSADAGCGHPHHPQGRRGDRRIQHPVCG